MHTFKYYSRPKEEVLSKLEKVLRLRRISY